MLSLMRCLVFRNMLPITGLGYDFSSPSIASTSTSIFVPPANNIETDNNVVKDDLATENIGKGKSIVGALLK